MPCTEAYREHIMYTFNGYCKTVIRFAAINAWRDRSRRRQKEISLEYLTEEKFYPLGTTDEYFETPYEEYPVTICGQTCIAGAAASLKDRNEYISRLCSFPLLILDDFGMERGTKYGLGQIYNVIDSRYRSGKPLIMTTNLTLEELQNPEDTAHARIYDRLTEMCCPVCITGENFRKAKAQAKMERLKILLNRKESL